MLAQEDVGTGTLIWQLIKSEVRDRFGILPDRRTRKVGVGEDLDDDQQSDQQSPMNQVKLQHREEQGIELEPDE